MINFDHEDGSCSKCDGHAVRRYNKENKHTFYGCSNYPKCRNTESVRISRGEFLISNDDIDIAYYEAERWGR